MGYLDKHLALSQIQGTTIKEQQFNTTAQFINAHFSESPFYRLVKLNGQDFEVQLQDIQVVTRSASVSLVQNLLKFIVMKPNTSVSIGDMLEITDEQTNEVVYWIVTDSVSDNTLFPKAKIEKCNYTLQVKTGETKTLKGYDSLKRPVYDIVPTITPVQCLLRNTVSTLSLNQEINLASGQIYLTVPYNDISKAINENDEFDIYNRQFKIIGFDFTNVVNGVGCVIMIAERVVNT